MYVVTGASDGLGLALATLLAKKGKKVVSLSRTKPKAKGVGHIMCDLTNEGSINQAAQELSAMPEPLTALVNNAGFYAHQPLEELTGQLAATMYTTNIIGPTLLTARLMERIKKDGADVLNIASVAGLKGSADGAVYASTKWAVRGFTQSLQATFKDTPSRATCICPAWFGSEPDKNPGMMSVQDLAAFVVTILLLPKKMEVNEVIITAK